MHRTIRIRSLRIWVLIALTGGCAGQRHSETATEPVRVADVTTAAAVDAAQKILVRMHFDIEKADADHGTVRTRPLRSAQVFEFWRQDSPTPADLLEADIQTMRKLVEIDFKPTDSQLAIRCRVRVQRLSLPEAGTASVSHAYQMHSRSTATEQSLQLSARQQRQMAWIDLPDDPVLAQRIVEQVASKAEKSSPEGAP
jgi:hypothetical protein